MLEVLVVANSRLVVVVVFLFITIVDPSDHSTLCQSI